MSETRPAEIDAIERTRRIKAAHDEIARLCTGGRWRMTIPADPRRDSDLILSDGLDAAENAAADFLTLAACDLCAEQVPADELTDGRECGRTHCPGHRCLPCARDKAADR